MVDPAGISLPMNPPQRRSRSTLSTRVRTDLLVRLREFVRDNAGKPLYLTMSSFIEEAIEVHLEAVERRLSGDLPHRRRNAAIENTRS
jgi:hypothetical protein